VEYLIIDNQSSDQTPEILLENAGNNFSLIPLQANKIRSAYAARNVGIQASRGKILAFTDVDCRPQPHWLEELIKPLENPQINLVVGEITGLASNNWLEIYAEKMQILSQHHTLNHENLPYGQTANLALRKSVLAQVGLFRPYLTTGGDADLCWRIQGKFPNCLEFCPQAIVHHRHRSTLQEFYHQWYKYGSSNYYLWELHRVSLMQPLGWRDYLYRLLRWLGRELPDKIMTQGLAIEPRTLAEIFQAPLGLFGTWARLQGQNSCKIPPNLAEIEWLAPNSSEVQN
jgi:cellulose synthase/poly-beta-1,6-N-acetylglucosamine synthase-like glycosyltransferase